MTGLVGAEGFEPPTSCSQSRRATRLRYAPIRSDARPAGRGSNPSLRKNGKGRTLRRERMHYMPLRVRSRDQRPHERMIASTAGKMQQFVHQEYP